MRWACLRPRRLVPESSGLREGAGMRGGRGFLGAAYPGLATNVERFCRPAAMSRRILGMASVAAGASVFSVQDAIVKGLSGTYPVHEIVVVRSLVALPILLLITLAED